MKQPAEGKRFAVKSVSDYDQNVIITMHQTA